MTRCRRYGRLCVKAGTAGAAFILLMILLRGEMTVNIALTAVFVFAMFAYPPFVLFMKAVFYHRMSRYRGVAARWPSRRADMR